MHVNPVLRGISDDRFSLIYDVDRRKYLLFTRRVPNLPRDISLFESHDLVNWEDKGRGSSACSSQTGFPRGEQHVSRGWNRVAPPVNVNVQPAP